VFVEGTEKRRVPDFGFSVPVDNPALQGRKRLPQEKLRLARPKDGGLAYTE
jgi:hypothetical protein